jgi:hypothetical protein
VLEADAALGSQVASATMVVGCEIQGMARHTRAIARDKLAALDIPGGARRMPPSVGGTTMAPRVQLRGSSCRPCPIPRSSIT